MRCTVTWLTSTQNALALLWVQGPDRQAITDAADEIDRLLLDEALDVGEELGDYRRLRVPPLEVVYSVSPDDRLVQVLRVARVP
jgi:hypothetical protein